MPFFKRKPGIAVIEMHGVIGTAIKEPEYSKLLENVRNNRKIGALVLDIDSPGGSATASDLIYENVREVARRKPVVAYVRGLGASGGYYIACGAGTIMASRAALVGSIGVIYLRPILQQLFGKLGVEFSVFKAGRLKDMSGFWRMPTDEESDKFQSLIGEMYDLFVSVVTDSRRMTDEQVRELATGEVYTARQARESGPHRPAGRLRRRHRRGHATQRRPPQDPSLPPQASVLQPHWTPRSRRESIPACPG